VRGAAQARPALALFARLMAAVPGSWLLCWFPGLTGGGDPAERLLRFTGLRDQRLITEMGCQARRAEVLKVLKAL